MEIKYNYYSYDLKINVINLKKNYSYFNIIILGIWIICRVVKNQTTWNYLLFLFCLLFLIIWRIDIGVGVILAATVSIVFVLINFKNKIHFKSQIYLVCNRLYLLQTKTSLKFNLIFYFLNFKNP